MRNAWIAACTLLFISAPGLTQAPPQKPAIDLEKAMCSATANCESGTVKCTSRRSGGSCTAVDFNRTTGEIGYVTCDGQITNCPRFDDVCHLEQMPAATLLLPYFEVDTKGSGFSDTLVAVANAFETPVLVKAEVWTDLGVALFGFNIHLDGHDVKSFSLSDLLVKGTLPSSQPGNFSSCKDSLPPLPIDKTKLEGYQAALQGRSSSYLGGNCGGLAKGDSVMRGYLTFDTVRVCTTLNQTTPGYFGTGGSGIPTNQNALWGDYFYVNFLVNTKRVTAGFPLVHIRASSTDPATTTPGRYTFYGRFDRFSAADNRQPLATNFGVRFLNTPALNSDLIVWRDPKAIQSAFRCGTKPVWYPLGQERLLAFDEDGRPADPQGGYAFPFPAVTQRVPVGALSLSGVGWLYLDLNAGIPTSPSPADPAAAQAWVTVLQSTGAIGVGVGVGVDALKYDTACEARHYEP